MAKLFRLDNLFKFPDFPLTILALFTFPEFSLISLISRTAATLWKWIALAHADCNNSHQIMENCFIFLKTARITAMNYSDLLLPIDRFTKCHKVVHNGGFPMPEVLCCGQNSLKSIKIQ